MIKRKILELFKIFVLETFLEPARNIKTSSPTVQEIWKHSDSSIKTFICCVLLAVGIGMYTILTNLHSSPSEALFALFVLTLFVIYANKPCCDTHHKQELFKAVFKQDFPFLSIKQYCKTLYGFPALVVVLCFIPVCFSLSYNIIVQFQIQRIYEISMLFMFVAIFDLALRHSWSAEPISLLSALCENCQEDLNNLKGRLSNA